MKGKAAMVVGLATGYVLGARDGRGRYEQLKTQADRLWHDPKVQKNVAQAQGIVKEKAPQVSAKVSDVAQKASSKATSKVKGGDDSTSDVVVDTSVIPPSVPPTTSVPPSTTYSTPSTTTLPSDQRIPGDLNG